MLLSFFFVAAIVVPSPGPSPAPSPEVLQEIGRTRAVSPLCRTLRERVAPALVAMLSADVVIAGGRDRLTTMGTHQVLKQRAQLEMDRLSLSQTVGRLVRNLRTIDDLLADKSRFPVLATSDDEREALTMKAQLQAVTDEQKTALNAINGTLETDLLGLMQHSKDGKIDTALTGTHADDFSDEGPLTGLDSAGLPASPSDVVDPRSTARSLFGHTLYDVMAYAVEIQRTRIVRAERSASATVIANARRCGADVPVVP